MSKQKPNLPSRRFSMEPLEQRCLLAADIVSVPLSVEQFTDQILRREITAYPSAGEMVFLASGPSPDELEILAPTNVAAADTTNADQLQVGGISGLDLTGAGYSVGVWEVGGLIRSTHDEFGARVIEMESGSYSDHATHVAGTIGAAGVDPEATGMATGVALRSWLAQNDPDVPSVVSEMRSEASNIVASNHSYGQFAG